MKPPSLLFRLLSATLIAGAVPALRAQDGMAAETAPSQAAGTAARRDLVKKYDKNGDGRLDEDEKAAARAEMRESGEMKTKADRGRKILSYFDTDHDGKLNDAERAAFEKARARLENNREEILKRFDKNRDGVLDDAERAEAIHAFQERQKKRLGAKASRPEDTAKPPQP